MNLIHKHYLRTSRRLHNAYCRRIKKLRGDLLEFTAAGMKLDRAYARLAITARRRMARALRRRAQNL